LWSSPTHVLTFSSHQTPGSKILKSRRGEHDSVLCNYIEQVSVNRLAEE
jgi:hypothetical protein